MTIIEALSKVEQILGTIPVVGRENVSKINDIFALIDASIGALNHPKEQKNDGDTV